MVDLVAARGEGSEEANYECRHGLSYSKFSCEYSDIKAEQTLFIPMGDDVELWDVRLRNTGSKPRKLSVFSYVEFSFHHIEIDNQNLQMSLYAAWVELCRTASSSTTSSTSPGPFTTWPPASNRTATTACAIDFFGNYRTETNPIAVEQGECQNTSELGGNHCGALHKRLTLAPGEETRIVFMLGVGPRATGKEIKAKYSDLAAVDAAFEALKSLLAEEARCVPVQDAESRGWTP